MLSIIMITSRKPNDSFRSKTSRFFNHAKPLLDSVHVHQLDVILGENQSFNDVIGRTILDFRPRLKHCRSTILQHVIERMIVLDKLPLNSKC